MQVRWVGTYFFWNKTKIDHVSYIWMFFGIFETESVARANENNLM